MKSASGKPFKHVPKITKQTLILSALMSRGQSVMERQRERSGQDDVSVRSGPTISALLGLNVIRRTIK